MKQQWMTAGPAVGLMALAALLGLVGVASGRSAGPASAVPTAPAETRAASVAARTAPAVRIEGEAFTPAVLEVAAGTTVTWTNEDEDAHTVTSVSGAFGSAGLSHEDTFSQTFTRPGVYQYFCKVHPHMRATVIVR